MSKLKKLRGLDITASLTCLVILLCTAHVNSLGDSTPSAVVSACLNSFDNHLSSWTFVVADVGEGGGRADLAERIEGLAGVVFAAGTSKSQSVMIKTTETRP